jgi:hypothetical protein
MIADLILFTLIIGVLVIAVMLVMGNISSYRDDEDDWF